MKNGKALRCKTVRQLLAGEQFYFVDESFIDNPEFDSAIYYVTHVEDYGACTGIHALLFDSMPDMGDKSVVHKATMILNSATPVVLTKDNLDMNEAITTTFLLSESDDIDGIEYLRDFMSADLISAMYDSLIDSAWDDLMTYGQLEIALFWDANEFEIDELPLYTVEYFFGYSCETLDE